MKTSRARLESGGRRREGVAVCGVDKHLSLVWRAEGGGGGGCG
jgi:hypothetical protein